MKSLMAERQKLRGSLSVGRVRGMLVGMARFVGGREGRECRDVVEKEEGARLMMSGGGVGDFWVGGGGGGGEEEETGIGAEMDGRGSKRERWVGGML